MLYPSKAQVEPPRDKEFSLVDSKYKLKVWFRGNLAGWEKWFDYEKIGRNTHKIKIKEFIY